MELRELEAFGEPGAVVYLADCVELMRLMPAGCVDAVFADPPYRLSNGGVTVKSGRVSLTSAPMEEEALAGEFGALIRRFRLANALSQEGLAEAANLERAYVGMIERGETNVSLRTVNRLARALGLSLTGLFAELEGEARATDGE